MIRPASLLAVAVLVIACGPGAAPATNSSAGPVASGIASAPASPPRATDKPSLGAVRTDATGVDQVWVPAGTFTMGSDAAAIGALAGASPPAWVAAEFPSEQPAHEVTLTAGYWIDRTEVTNAAYSAFVDAGGYTTEAYWSVDGWAWLGERDTRGLPKRCPGDAPEVPRRCITWYEAEAYASWRGGALPTEAQWEYAARGPESRIYPWGDEWDPALAHVEDATAARAVGGSPGGGSWVGALDMSGNAMEWVADWLGPYAAVPAEDPTGPVSGEVKVEKGGWWGSNAIVARAAYRHYEDPPSYQDAHIGVRVVSP